MIDTKIDISQIVPGSTWVGPNSVEFVVIEIANIDSNIWVHYRKKHEPQEYSCWAESFLDRFRLYQNYQ